MRFRILHFALPITLAALASGCEDLPVGPDGVATSTQTAAGRAGISLDDLFAAAVVRIQRDAGADSARSVLMTWRAVERQGGRPEARRVEAKAILDAFGPDVLDQAVAVVAGALRDAHEAAIGRADSDAIAQSLASGARSVDFARSARADQLIEALLALDDAAAHVADVHSALSEPTRAPTLEVLFDRALAESPDAAAQRALDRDLASDVEEAVVGGDIGRRYDALQAMRTSRSEFVASTLGPDVVIGLLDDIDRRLRTVAPRLRERSNVGEDVAREQRMLDATEVIAQRARKALAEGDAARAVDLAAHAAGLADQLQRDDR